MREHVDPWDDWDEYLEAGLVSESGDDGEERPVVRSRLVRGTIWFALAIMPAREQWFGWLLPRPHPVVKPHDGDLGVTLPSLPSRS
jgi:hypothetical protein